MEHGGPTDDASTCSTNQLTKTYSLKMSAKQDRLRNLYISLKLTFTLTITLISLIYRGMYDFELNEWCVTHVKKMTFYFNTPPAMSRFLLC